MCRYISYNYFFFFFDYSYIELSKRIEGDGSPIFALDDKVLSSGVNFIFKSIEEVAEACMPHVKKILSDVCDGDSEEVVLAGWSYGGVVASVVAAMLTAEEKAEGLDSHRVKSLLLFDSPITDPQQHRHDYDGPAEAQSNDESVTAVDYSASIEQRTKYHFDSCTDLLKLRYASESGVYDGSLQCPVLDIRPEVSNYYCALEDIQKLTVGRCERMKTKGDHWTMLFGANTEGVAEVVSGAISSSN